MAEENKIINQHSTSLNMAAQNDIGEFGEAIFKARLTQDYNFKVYFMGDKAVAVDFLVEINDTATPYQFLVQVKSTINGYYKKTGFVKAYMPDAKRNDLLLRPLPTYVAGVDVNEEKVYISPVFNNTVSFEKGIPVAHLLSKQDPVATQQTMDLLKRDVIAFWNASGINHYKSSYRSLL